MTKITTRIERLHNTRRGKHWCKQVERVDPNKSNGFAFEGPWVNMGSSVEVPAGAVILCSDDDVTSGGNFRGRTIRVLAITERGQAEVESLYTQDRGWALQVRDKIAELLPRHERFRVRLTARQLELVEKCVDLSRSFIARDCNASGNEIEAVEKALREAEAID